MKKIKRLSMILALAMLTLMLTACGGGGTPAPTPEVNADGTLSAAKTDALNIYLCAQYVSDDAAQALAEELTKRVPEFADGNVKLNITSIATGSGEDPTLQMGGMMKLTAGIAAGEVYVIIADDTNAARNARGESFYALSELLTADEITALGERALAYDMLDDEGNPSGEKTPVCGVDVTGDEQLVTALGDGKIGAFVAGNAPNLENAKALLRALAGNDE